jgi:hypothetical protein
MEAEKIKDLLFKYNAGDAGPGEIREIENLIEQGTIQLDDIEGFGKMSDQIVAIETPGPSRSLDEKFHQMMRQERGVAKKAIWKNFFSPIDFMPRLAFASLALLVGLAVGYILRSPAKKDEQIVEMRQEIHDLKEMMMLSLLEKESATDRLKGCQSDGTDGSGKQTGNKCLTSDP